MPVVATAIVHTATLVLENSREIELGEFTDDQVDDIRHHLLGGLRDVPVCLSSDALHKIQSWLRSIKKRPGIDLTHPSYLSLVGKYAELVVTPVAA